MITKRLVLYAGLGAFVCVGAYAALASGARKATQKYTGTFSDLRYVETAGEFVGVEVRIVNTRVGYQATVQFSEDGDVSELALAAVKVAGESVRLDFQTAAGGLPAALDGKVNAKHLWGVIRLGDVEETVDLPRKAGSYWDR